MGRIARNCAREVPEIGSSMAKMRSLVAALHSAFVANKEVVKHYGQCWGSAIRDSSGSQPGVPVDGIDVAISAWAANL